MKKVLILVLSSEKFYYKDLMEAQMKTWDSEKVEGVETFFYTGVEGDIKVEYDEPKWVIHDNRGVLNFPIKETLLNVSKKTWMAFKFAMNNFDFDFIFRPNASTYVNKQELFNYIQDKPDNYFTGLPAPLPDGREFMWGVQYIISRDLVELAVNKAWDYSKMDDIALSLVLEGKTEFRRGRQATIHKRENDYQVLTYNEGTGGGFETQELKLIEGQYAYRCKQDFDRKLDIQIMEELWKSKQ